MKIKIREDGLTAGTCLQAAFFFLCSRAVNKRNTRRRERKREKKKGKPLTFSDFLEKKFPR